MRSVPKRFSSSFGLSDDLPARGVDLCINLHNFFLTQFFRQGEFDQPAESFFNFIIADYARDLQQGTLFELDAQLYTFGNNHIDEKIAIVGVRA